MVVVFQDNERGDDHDAFQKWRRKHPKGFFINCRPKLDWMLHRVNCAHHGDGSWTVREGKATLTKTQKACSRSTSELTSWAAKHGVDKLNHCAQCLPDSLKTVAKKLVDKGEFDLKGIEDSRERVLASIVRRQGQPKFRRQVKTAYQGRCAISGCSIESILDAAHIYPYLGEPTNHVTNGLLLRTDLHTLFDLGLITIDPQKLTVLVADSLCDSCYAELHGQAISIPLEERYSPSRDALEKHRNQSGL